jgi:hypothetical protein
MEATYDGLVFGSAHVALRARGLQSREAWN